MIEIFVLLFITVEGIANPQPNSLIQSDSNFTNSIVTPNPITYSPTQTLNYEVLPPISQASSILFETHPLTSSPQTIASFTKKLEQPTGSIPQSYASAVSTGIQSIEGAPIQIPLQVTNYSSFPNGVASTPQMISTPNPTLIIENPITNAATSPPEYSQSWSTIPPTTNSNALPPTNPLINNTLANNSISLISNQSEPAPIATIYTNGEPEKTSKES